MSGMIHPEWWTGSLADAQERVFAGRSTFGETVDFLVADFLTSGRFLSFLVAATEARMVGGHALDEAVYAVVEEAAARLHATPVELTAGRPGLVARPVKMVCQGSVREGRPRPGVSR
jgi:hypothetical protein